MSTHAAVTGLIGAALALGDPGADVAVALDAANASNWAKTGARSSEQAEPARNHGDALPNPAERKICQTCGHPTTEKG